MFNFIKNYCGAIAFGFVLVVIPVFLTGLFIYDEIKHPCIEHKDWVHEVTVCTQPHTGYCGEYEKVMKHQDVCLRYKE